MPSGFESPHPPPPPPPPGAPPPPHAPPPAHGPPPPPQPPGFGHPGFDFPHEFFAGPPGPGGHFHGFGFHHGPHHRHGSPGFGPFGRRGPRGGRGRRGDDTDEEYAEMMEQFREWGGRGRGHHGHGRRGGPPDEKEDVNDESGPEDFVDVKEDGEGSRPPPRGPPGRDRHGWHFGPPPPPPPPPPPGEAWGHFGFGGPWGQYGGSWGNAFDGPFGPRHHHHGRGFGRGKKPFPRVDILANEAQVVIEVELPGVRKEDITARVDDEGSSVTIEGTFPERAESELKRVYGERRAEAGAAFARTIPLRGPVDKDSVRAKLADGVLTVTLAKVQVEEPQGTTVNIE